MAKMLQRFGDGYLYEMTWADLKKDIVEGTENAAERARISSLSEEEIQCMYDIYSSPRKFVSSALSQETKLFSVTMVAP